MLIALANRPGFPFLGNNFFREIGDIFSTHVITNPDTESELELLNQNTLQFISIKKAT